MNDNFVAKNKFVLILVVVMGLFLIFSIKTDFSFMKYFKNQYIPGQQSPNIQPPSIQQPPKPVGESEWRRTFERERE